MSDSDCKDGNSDDNVDSASSSEEEGSLPKSSSDKPHPASTTTSSCGAQDRDRAGAKEEFSEDSDFSWEDSEDSEIDQGCGGHKGKSGGATATPDPTKEKTEEKASATPITAVPAPDAIASNTTTTAASATTTTNTAAPGDTDSPEKVTPEIQMENIGSEEKKKKRPKLIGERNWQLWVVQRVKRMDSNLERLPVKHCCHFQINLPGVDFTEERILEPIFREVDSRQAIIPCSRYERHGQFGGFSCGTCGADTTTATKIPVSNIKDNTDSLSDSCSSIKIQDSVANREKEKSSFTSDVPIPSVTSLPATFPTSTSPTRDPLPPPHSLRVLLISSLISVLPRESRMSIYLSLHKIKTEDQKESDNHGTSTKQGTDTPALTSNSTTPMETTETISTEKAFSEAEIASLLIDSVTNPVKTLSVLSVVIPEIERLCSVDLQQIHFLLRNIYRFLNVAPGSATLSSREIEPLLKLAEQWLDKGISILDLELVRGSVLVTIGFALSAPFMLTSVYALKALLKAQPLLPTDHIPVCWKRLVKLPTQHIAHAYDSPHVYIVQNDQVVKMDTGFGNSEDRSLYSAPFVGVGVLWIPHWSHEATDRYLALMALDCSTLKVLAQRIVLKNGELPGFTANQSYSFAGQDLFIYLFTETEYHKYELRRVESSLNGDFVQLQHLKQSWWTSPPPSTSSAETNKPLIETFSPCLGLGSNCNSRFLSPNTVCLSSNTNYGINARVYDLEKSLCRFSVSSSPRSIFETSPFFMSRIHATCDICLQSEVLTGAHYSEETKIDVNSLCSIISTSMHSMAMFRKNAPLWESTSGLSRVLCEILKLSLKQVKSQCDQLPLSTVHLLETVLLTTFVCVRKETSDKSQLLEIIALIKPLTCLGDIQLKTKYNELIQSLCIKLFGTCLDSLQKTSQDCFYSVICGLPQNRQTGLLYANLVMHQAMLMPTPLAGSSVPSIGTVRPIFPVDTDTDNGFQPLTILEHNNMITQKYLHFLSFPSPVKDFASHELKLLQFLVEKLICYGYSILPLMVQLVKDQLKQGGAKAQLPEVLGKLAAMLDLHGRTFKVSQMRELMSLCFNLTKLLLCIQSVSDLPTAESLSQQILYCLFRLQLETKKSLKERLEFLDDIVNKKPGSSAAQLIEFMDGCIDLVPPLDQDPKIASTERANGKSSEKALFFVEDFTPSTAISDTAGTRGRPVYVLFGAVSVPPYNDSIILERPVLRRCTTLPLIDEKLPPSTPSTPNPPSKVKRSALARSTTMSPSVRSVRPWAQREQQKMEELKSRFAKWKLIRSHPSPVSIEDQSDPLGAEIFSFLQHQTPRHLYVNCIESHQLRANCMNTIFQIFSKVISNDTTGKSTKSVIKFARIVLSNQLDIAEEAPLCGHELISSTKHERNKFAELAFSCATSMDRSLARHFLSLITLHVPQEFLEFLFNLGVFKWTRHCTQIVPDGVAFYSYNSLLLNSADILKGREFSYISGWITNRLRNFCRFLTKHVYTLPKGNSAPLRAMPSVPPLSQIFVMNTNSTITGVVSSFMWPLSLLNILSTKHFRDHISTEEIINLLFSITTVPIIKVVVLALDTLANLLPVSNPSTTVINSLMMLVQSELVMWGNLLPLSELKSTSPLESNSAVPCLATPATAPSEPKTSSVSSAITNVVDQGLRHDTEILAVRPRLTIFTSAPWTPENSTESPRTEKKKIPSLQPVPWQVNTPPECDFIQLSGSEAHLVLGGMGKHIDILSRLCFHVASVTSETLYTQSNMMGAFTRAMKARPKVAPLDVSPAILEESFPLLLELLPRICFPSTATTEIGISAMINARLYTNVLYCVKKGLQLNSVHLSIPSHVLSLLLDYSSSFLPTPDCMQGDTKNSNSTLYSLPSEVKHCVYSDVIFDFSRHFYTKMLPFSASSTAQILPTQFSNRTSHGKCKFLSPLVVRLNTKDFSVATTNCPIKDSFYFEVYLKELSGKYIVVGFATKSPNSFSKAIVLSMGGKLMSLSFANDTPTVEEELGTCTPLSSGDVVGCGWLPATEEIFFTANGVLLGKKVRCTLDGLLWPVVTHTIGMGRGFVILNLGQWPMLFAHNACAGVEGPTIRLQDLLVEMDFKKTEMISPQLTPGASIGAYCHSTSEGDGILRGFGTDRDKALFETFQQQKLVPFNNLGIIRSTMFFDTSPVNSMLQIILLENLRACTLLAAVLCRSLSVDCICKMMSAEPDRAHLLISSSLDAPPKHRKMAQEYTSQPQGNIETVAEKIKTQVLQSLITQQVPSMGDFYILPYVISSSAAEFSLHLPSILESSLALLGSSSTASSTVSKGQIATTLTRLLASLDPLSVTKTWETTHWQKFEGVLSHIAQMPLEIQESQKSYSELPRRHIPVESTTKWGDVKFSKSLQEMHLLMEDFIRYKNISSALPVLLDSKFSTPKVRTLSKFRRLLKAFYQHQDLPLSFCEKAYQRGAVGYLWEVVGASMTEQQSGRIFEFPDALKVNCVVDMGLPEEVVIHFYATASQSPCSSVKAGGTKQRIIGSSCAITVSHKEPEVKKMNSHDESDSSDSSDSESEGKNLKSCCAATVSGSSTTKFEIKKAERIRVAILPRFPKHSQVVQKERDFLIANSTTFPTWASSLRDIASLANEFKIETQYPLSSHNVLLLWGYLKSHPHSFQSLADLPSDEFLFRAGCLVQFNKDVSKHIKEIALYKFYKTKNTTGHMLKQLSGILFYDVKQKYFDWICRSQRQASEPKSLHIRRCGSIPLICQLQRQFDEVKDYQLRPQGMQEGFEVKMAGEGAEDAGGPYREAISSICKEVSNAPGPDSFFTSDYAKLLPLFILCPNAKLEEEQMGIGENRDKYIPNPNATSPEQIKLFNTIGKLMGICLRGNSPMPLNLANIVWKQILGITPDKKDLKSIDQFCYQCLADIKKAQLKGITSDTFSDTFCLDSFTITLSDGREKELIPNAKSTPVTWDNRFDFVEKAIEARLGECKPQIDAIVSGLNFVVPLKSLSLITPKELEIIVTGSHEMRYEQVVARLKNKRCPVQQFQFLKLALSEFTKTQLGLFVKFISGREILPSDPTVQLNVVQYHCDGNPDRCLPKASTCFYELKLPAYTSVDATKDRLLYAITACADIDADFTGDRNANGDGDDDGDASSSENDDDEEPPSSSSEHDGSASSS
ncbi:ubiquitin protein ligase [Pelomyxa schiedti]|nr:ubiquitin protein ligase [Pelomyxa schiedti]